MRRLLHLAGALITLIALLRAAAPAFAQSTPGNTATLKIAFRACADGIDPESTPEQCTGSIEAPDAALIWPQGVTKHDAKQVASMPRDEKGLYTLGSLGAGKGLRFEGFEPTDYNYFMFTGVDSSDTKWSAATTLDAGEVSEVTVYYWNGAKGPIQPATNTVVVKLRACPDGADPRVDVSPCTTPLDATGNISWRATSRGEALGDDWYNPLANQPRRNDGSYVIDDLPSYTHLSIQGSTKAPEGANRAIFVGEDTQQTHESHDVWMVRGETREIVQYWFTASDESTATTAPTAPATVAPTATTTSQTATVRLAVRHCPDGVNPNADGTGQCTETATAPDDASLVPLYDATHPFLLRDQGADASGTYVLTIPEGAYSLRGFNVSGETNIMTGVRATGIYGPVLSVKAGTTVEVGVFYYTAAPPATPQT